MDCPKCGAANMFDNRTTKKNPKAPDYKCRDRNCDGVIWPPKEGTAKATPTAYVPQDAGPYVPGLDDAPALPTDTDAKSTRLYLAAMQFVVDTVVPVWEAGKISYTASDVNAATATIMIDHQRRSGR